MLLAPTSTTTYLRPAGRGLVRAHGGSNQGHEGVLIERIVLVEVDGRLQRRDHCAALAEATRDLDPAGSYTLAPRALNTSTIVSCAFLTDSSGATLLTMMSCTMSAMIRRVPTSPNAAMSFGSG